MNFPDNLRYTEEHEWIRLEKDGTTAVVGVTDFAQRELGDVVFVELEPAGTEIERDGVFGTIEAVKTVSELYMPVAGTLVAHNEDLESSPELVNEDPYGAGWMVKIEVREASELDTLLDAQAYEEMVG